MIIIFSLRNVPFIYPLGLVCFLAFISPLTLTLPSCFLSLCKVNSTVPWTSFRLRYLESEWMNIWILCSYLFIKRMRKIEGECRKYMGNLPWKSWQFQHVWNMLMFSSRPLKLLELKKLWISINPAKHIQ